MKKLKLIFICSLVCCVNLLAQTGQIDGIVLDSESGTPLVGANIFVEEIQGGAAANNNGKFTIKNLQEGEYTLSVSFIGFERIEKRISVVEGKPTTLDLVLNPAALALSDVEITQSLPQNATIISNLDIKLQPITTSQDVLRIVPGLFIAQHAGGGKAEQIFLRGFDIDHGTDIALTVDGMPVNMVSHAHGQGYSDLHFVIPETIERVSFDKGTYYTSKGNLNTAGFADFTTKKRLSNNLIKLEGGQFGTFRTVGMINLLSSESITDPSLFLATEYFGSQGYFESPQDFTRFNALIKFHQRISRNKTLEISASHFTSQWNASGQIPVRAVESGRISRFGAIDDTEGGKTGRFNFNTNLITDLSDGGFLQNQLFFSNYDFNLISNFTFFLNDPINGDQITQRENRQIYGANNTYWNNWNLFGLKASTEFGLGFRHDVVNDIRLSRTLNRTTILSDLARGDIEETNLHAYAEEELTLSKNVSLITGLRYDHFLFNYSDRLTTPGQNSESKGIASPKLQLSFQASDNLNIYLKSGLGFHSNDTRVVVAQRGNQILPKALGTDLGIHWKPNDNLLVNAAIWQLGLEQEFVYVGDEGVVEAGGKTHRQGIDLSMRYQLTPWLYATMDFNMTKARSVEDAEGQNYIPLAPRLTSIGGLNFNNGKSLSGSLRYRYIADRPANETYSVTAQGYFLLDAQLNYKIGSFDFGLSVENLTNTEWNEAQFETESRLANESQSVSEIHFTPGTPFQGRLSVGLRF